MARYARGQTARYNWLIKRGFLDFEASEISGAYPTFQKTKERSDPSVYIRRMATSRYQTVIQLRRYGYSNEMIIDYIGQLYQKRDWLYIDGEINPWKMLDYFRDISLAKGEYFPTAKRRAHGRSISKGDVAGQRARAKARARAKKGLPETLSEYDKGRGR